MKDLNFIVPLRDPRMIVMSYANWRVWKLNDHSFACPAASWMQDYFEKAAKRVNTMLMRAYERQHRAGVLFYLQTTMLEYQPEVARQFAEYLRVLPAPVAHEGEGAQEQDSSLFAAILQDLPRALEEEVSTLPSSRLGTVAHKSSEEEEMHLCEWAGGGAVAAMDAFLHTGQLPYAAALFPASIDCDSLLAQSPQGNRSTCRPTKSSTSSSMSKSGSESKASKPIKEPGESSIPVQMQNGAQGRTQHPLLATTILVGWLTLCLLPVAVRPIAGGWAREETSSKTRGWKRKPGAIGHC